MATSRSASAWRCRRTAPVPRAASRRSSIRHAHRLQPERDLERRRLQRPGRRAPRLLRDRRRHRAALDRPRPAVADLELRQQLADRLRRLLFAATSDAPRRGRPRPCLPPPRRAAWEDLGQVGTRGRARRRAADRAPRRALRGDLELRLDARARPGSRRPAASTATPAPGRWEDCGQPGSSRRLFSLASYRGDLLAVGDDSTATSTAAAAWEQVTAFDTFAHPLTVHDGRLVLGMLQPATVRAFDGSGWEDLGNPIGDPPRCDEIHTLVTLPTAGCTPARGRSGAWPAGMPPAGAGGSRAASATAPRSWRSSSTTASSTAQRSRAPRSSATSGTARGRACGGSSTRRAGSRSWCGT